MLPLCQSCVALKGWRELLWTSTLRFSDNLFFNEKKWGVGGEGMGEAAEQLGISMNKKKKRDPFFHPSLLVRNVVGAPRAERVNSYFPFSCHRKKKIAQGLPGIAVLDYTSLQQRILAEIPAGKGTVFIGSFLCTQGCFKAV